MTPAERTLLGNEAKAAMRAAGTSLNAFPCAACGGKTTVTDSRPTTKISGVRRRRQCLDCGERFRTYEVREPDRDLSDPRVLLFKKKLCELQAMFDALPGGLEWDDL